MAGNRLGDAASFEMPSLAGLLTTGDSEAVADAPEARPHRHRPVVMFPLLQLLRLHENSIRSIQGLQLFGFTGLQLASSALNVAGASTNGHKYASSVKWCPDSTCWLTSPVLMPPLCIQVFEVWTYTETS